MLKVGRLCAAGGEKGNDPEQPGVYPALQSSYSTEKICKDPPLRHPEQQLEAWETAEFTGRFKHPDSGSKTQNFAQ